VTGEGRLVLLVTSPRVAPELLSAAAWAALQAGPVFVVDDAKPTGHLTAAGVTLQPISIGLAALEPAVATILSATDGATATCWVEPDVDAVLIEALQSAAAERDVAVELMHGSWDLPGARLLDVVATMDRLRSPGGCPWDAKQDHASLAPYLLEEAYEAFQAIEDENSAGLCEELGDVLLQIAFHARIAEELPAAQRWTIDDVANGLVDKLVRRHPHVFSYVDAADVDEVNENWEAIKAAERGGASALVNVPLAAAALTLAATLQRKAARAGVTDLGVQPLAELVSRFEAAPSADAAGRLLWSVVAAMRAADIDAETALRTHGRAFRDAVAETGGPPAA
jgi:XTP/dITP diphosphohydrolase